MYLFGLFDIGKSAMFASQAALSVASNNIANVNTPGFSRQEVILEVSPPVLMQSGFLGTGVTVSGIKRNYDSFIQSQLFGQYQNYGRSSALDQAMSRIEQIFNDAGGAGLSGPLTDYINAWQDVGTNPSGQTQRTELLQKANSLVIAAKRMESGIIDNLSNTNKEIDDVVGRINSIASQIASLNGKIVQAEGGAASGGEANDLRDQRDNLLNDLANLTEFSSFEENDGSVNISIGMKNLVYREKTTLLSTVTTYDGNKDIYLDGTDITSRIEMGQLGGLISARDTLEANQLKGIRKLVSSLIKEVNLLHSKGYGLDGTTGNDFFAPLQLSTKDFSSGADMAATVTDLSQLPLDEYDITFDNSGNYHILNRDRGAEISSGAYVSGNPITFDGIQINISGAVTSTDKFSVSPLTNAIKNFGVAVSDFRKIAAAGFDTTLPGDNANALDIAGLFGRAVTNLDGATFTDFYNGLVSGIGSISRAASDSLKFDESLLNDLKMRRESVSGVSLDEEAANLIKFQRSFEAGAKMIQVTDELLQAILNL